MEFSDQGVAEPPEARPLGRFVRVTDPDVAARQRATGMAVARWWETRPTARAERDANFFASRECHNRWPELGRFTCCAVVRGRRCSRITIIETDHRHCVRHAGPARARLYRENQRKLFQSGKLSVARWLNDEARRARTRTRDQQRRRDWTLPGVTIRFSPDIEARFQADLPPVLGARSWRNIPDLHRDRLRWAWRRFMLDRSKPRAWDAKARAIVLDLAGRGPIPADLPHAHGSEPFVLAVEQRATAFEWRSRVTEAEVARALRASAPASREAPGADAVRSSAKPRAVHAGFDHRTFLAQHWREVFHGIFEAFDIDADDGPTVRRLVMAYRSVLEGGDAGAWRRWSRLLREMGADH